MSPANIQEALRMLSDGMRFRCGYYEIAIYRNIPLCKRDGEDDWDHIGALWCNVPDWELIEDSEPVFEFKTWDKCLMMDGSHQSWTASLFSHYSDRTFRAVGGQAWYQLTAYSDDLVGTSKTPETPVWIVKYGKPEVLR